METYETRLGRAVATNREARASVATQTHNYYWKGNRPNRVGVLYNTIRTLR